MCDDNSDARRPDFCGLPGGGRSNNRRSVLQTLHALGDSLLFILSLYSDDDSIISGRIVVARAGMSAKM
jgi:hypothetical protein